jgi:hypothetical protein
MRHKQFRYDVWDGLNQQMGRQVEYRLSDAIWNKVREGSGLGLWYRLKDRMKYGIYETT